MLCRKSGQRKKWSKYVQVLVNCKLKKRKYSDEIQVLFWI